MFNFLQSTPFWSGAWPRSHAARSITKRTLRPCLEPLESRLLLNAGDLDVVFDGDGEATTALGFGSDQIHALAIRPDSKIVAVGQAASSDSDFALARYNLDGSLDASFGSAGEVLVGLSAGQDSTAQDVAVQADGQIVVAGFTGTFGSQ